MQTFNSEFLSSPLQPLLNIELFHYFDCCTVLERWTPFSSVLYVNIISFFLNGVYHLPFLVECLYKTLLHPVLQYHVFCLYTAYLFLHGSPPRNIFLLLKCETAIVISKQPLWYLNCLICDLFIYNQYCISWYIYW